MKKIHSLTEKELGIVESVLLDFNNHRLPRLLRIRDRVNAGETLDDYDINFLTECFEQSRGSTYFAEQHPEFKSLVAQVASLYHHITSKAIENQKE